MISISVGIGYAVQLARLWQPLTVYVAISLAYPPIALLFLARSSAERDRMRLLAAKPGFSRREAVPSGVNQEGVTAR